MAKDLLSDSADRYRAQHNPWILRLLLIALAGHLGGMLPAWADLFNAGNLLHRFARWVVGVDERVLTSVPTA